MESLAVFKTSGNVEMILLNFSPTAINFCLILTSRGFFSVFSVFEI